MASVPFTTPLHKNLRKLGWLRTRNHPQHLVFCHLGSYIATILWACVVGLFITISLAARSVDYVWIIHLISGSLLLLTLAAVLSSYFKKAGVLSHKVSFNFRNQHLQTGNILIRRRYALRDIQSITVEFYQPPAIITFLSMLADQHDIYEDDSDFNEFRLHVKLVDGRTYMLMGLGHIEADKATIIAAQINQLLRKQRPEGTTP